MGCDAIREVRGGPVEMTALACSTSGNHFVSGSRDSRLRLWDYDGGIYVAEGAAHSVVPALPASKAGGEGIRTAPDLARFLRLETSASERRGIGLRDGGSADITLSGLGQARRAGVEPVPPPATAPPIYFFPALHLRATRRDATS